MVISDRTTSWSSQGQWHFSVPSGSPDCSSDRWLWGKEGSAGSPNTMPMCVSFHLLEFQQLCTIADVISSLFSDQEIMNILGTLGHVVLANIGHHAVGYIFARQNIRNVSGVV